jgi:hypothetical protein
MRNPYPEQPFLESMPIGANTRTQVPTRGHRCQHGDTGAITGTQVPTRGHFQLRANKGKSRECRPGEIGDRKVRGGEKREIVAKRRPGVGVFNTGNVSQAVLSAGLMRTKCLPGQRG